MVIGHNSGWLLTTPNHQNDSIVGNILHCIPVTWSDYIHTGHNPANTEVDQLLIYSWSSVVDDGPTIIEH